MAWTSDHIAWTAAGGWMPSFEYATGAGGDGGMVSAVEAWMILQNEPVSWESEGVA
jgi:hypothetical protein